MNTTYDYQHVIESIVDTKLYGAPTTGTYKPTVVIGLGGTGVTTLRYLKRDLSMHEARHVRLLALDSNAAENTRFLSQLPALEPDRELRILDQAAALRMLANATTGNGSRHVLQYLPKEHGRHKGIHEEVIAKINGQKGAGQFRRAGKLLFQANARSGANLNDTLAKLREEMVGLRTLIEHQAAGLTLDVGVQVFVVCSAAGGQGAGCLLDCLALLRSHFNGPHDVITVICVLPGPLFHKVVKNPIKEGPIMRANAVALLRELQAAKQGHFSDYEFVFDQNLRITPGALPLFNDIFLVDHASHGLVPFHDVLDVFRGIAAFLYAITGTGVGAHREFSSINGRTDNRVAEDGLLRPYSALGIGGIRFPAGDLLGYGIRDSLDRWLTAWLEAQPEVTGEREDIASLLSGWQIASPDTFRAQFQPEIPEAVYLADPAQRRLVLKMSDPDFLGKGELKLKNFLGEMEAYAGQFKERRDAEVRRLQSATREQICHWLSLGAATAKSRLKALVDEIETLKMGFSAAAQDRKASRSGLLDRKNVLTEKINFWDFGLDAAPRKEYLVVINHLLALQTQERADSAAAECLHEIEKTLASHVAEMENFRSDLAVFAGQNRARVKELDSEKTDSCFMQSIVPSARYREWAAGNAFDVSPQLRPNSLRWDEFITQAVATVANSYVSCVNQFDLVAESLRDGSLLSRVKTIETASDYAIRLDLAAPSPAELEPQKFVAGDLRQGNSAAVSHFPPPEGGAQIVPIETCNKHMVMCVRTLHGIALAHWSGFHEAEGHYRQDPWWSHALARFELLPPLKALSSERSDALRTLGVALAFELIYPRGANYYRNVGRDELTNARWLHYFRKDLNRGGQALVDSELVKSAPSSQTRVKAEHLLGKSLAETLKALAEPDALAFKALVQELLDEYAAKAGRDQFKALIEEFVAGPLDHLIGQAEETRADWEQVARELRAYAQRLS